MLTKNKIICKSNLTNKNNKLFLRNIGLCQLSLISFKIWSWILYDNNSQFKRGQIKIIPFRRETILIKHLKINCILNLVN